jgi:sorbitol-specific phosphotransferase system component IIA
MGLGGELFGLFSSAVDLFRYLFEVGHWTWRFNGECGL